MVRRLDLFWFLNHAVNPVVRAVLRSPAHGLFSGSLMLVTVRGRKTGRRYILPVQYAQVPSGIYVVPGAPHRKAWWRNLQGGAPVDICLRGRDMACTAEVLTGDARRDAAVEGLKAYWERFPRSAQLHQIHRAGDGTFDLADLRSAATRAVVVRLIPRPHDVEEHGAVAGPF